jgi:hypothetical protein
MGCVRRGTENRAFTVNSSTPTRTVTSSVTGRDDPNNLEWDRPSDPLDLP